MTAAKTGRMESIMAFMPNKRTILIVGNFLSAATGTRGVSEDIADRLSERGWKVFCTSNKPNRLLRLIDIVATIWVRRFEYQAASVEVYSGLAFGLAVIASLMLKVTQKPFALTLHGGDLPSFSRRWSSPVFRLLSSAVVVTTPSRYLYEQLKSFRSDIRIIPNALDITNYVYHRRSCPVLKLIWLRAFHNIYNPSLAPKVLKILSDKYPDVHLTMIGPDKGDGSLQRTKQFAEAFGVADKITYPGRIEKSHVPLWLQNGDIFINTTNIDNTPISVIEAMACGLCVVSTNVGGLPYLLENEVDALLVPPDDPDAMATAVQRILKEPDLAVRLSYNARKKAEQFDWSIVLPQWKKLFNEMSHRGYH